MVKTFRKRAYAKSLGIKIKYTGKDYITDLPEAYKGLCKTWVMYNRKYNTLNYAHWDSPTICIDNEIFKFRIDTLAKDS